VSLTYYTGKETNYDAEEERLPYNEGWRKMEKPITQSDMNHLILGLIAVNEYKLEEVEQIGLGSFHLFTEAVEEAISNKCSVM
jgi:hypothetical protein